MMTSAVLKNAYLQDRGDTIITATVHNELKKSATLMGLGTRVLL